MLYPQAKLFVYLCSQQLQELPLYCSISCLFRFDTGLTPGRRRGMFQLTILHNLCTCTCIIDPSFLLICFSILLKKIFIDLYQGCFPADFSSYNLLANQMYKEVLAKVEESNGMYT